MKILFLYSLKEDLSIAAYSRHVMMKKTFSEIGEITSLNLYQEESSFLKKIKLFVFAKKRVKYALKTIDFDSFDVVFLSTISYTGMRYVKCLCLKKKIKLVIDCVEWASPEEKKFGKLSFSYIHNTRINEHLIDKHVSVISISSYLANYFKSKGIKTEVVPNLVDTNGIKYISKEKDSKIKLLFAGYPQKKDAINIAIEGLLMLDQKERELIHLTVAGITETDFFEKYNYLEEFKSNILSFSSFKGKVSYKEVENLYNESDFSLLVRNDKLRVCKAGLPTKLLDSFKYSTPIIANLSSDIGNYLKDGYNGYVVKEFSKEECCSTFKNIISLFINNSLDIRTLGHNAFESCIKNFNYLDYIDRIRTLIID